MIYTIIDFKEGTSRAVRDKKAVCEAIGISIPTLDKYVPDGGYYMMGNFVISRSELEKSGRGSVNN